MSKALLFLNGEPPHYFPCDIKHYALIACTDGAYHNYLQYSAIIPDYIIGDLDSIQGQTVPSPIKIIHTPDQNRTDFEKALRFLMAQQITDFTIYGANGKASDHFLANIAVALQYAKKARLHFYDDYGEYFFATSPMQLPLPVGQVISFIPITDVHDMTVEGCRYPLQKALLSMTGLVSARNQVVHSPVRIEFSQGDLLVFIDQPH